MLTPEEIEKAERLAKEWIRSEEGQAAMKEARENAKKAIEELTKPRKPLGCTCCPIHRNV